MPGKASAGGVRVAMRAVRVSPSALVGRKTPKHQRLREDCDSTELADTATPATEPARPVTAEVLPQWLITWQRESFPDAS